jgi:hypothetical protein
MNSFTMDFLDADDWVLLAVIHGGPGLRGILAAGDWINHAIFNYEELRGGLGRLLRAGLVRQSPKGWSAVSAAIRAIRIPGRGFTRQFAALQGVMAQAKVRKNAPRLRGLTPRTFKAAVEAYLKSE